MGRIFSYSLPPGMALDPGARCSTQEKIVMRMMHLPQPSSGGTRLKRSKKRDLILAAFASQNHVTAQTLHSSLAEEGHRISLGTIYRTMRLFCKMGLAQARHYDTKTQYGHPAARGYHDHLVCTTCGEIVEFENQEIQRLRREIAEANGFSLSVHKLELYGTCAPCRTSNN